MSLPIEPEPMIMVPALFAEASYHSVVFSACVAQWRSLVRSWAPWKHHDRLDMLASFRTRSEPMTMLPAAFAGVAYRGVVSFAFSTTAQSGLGKAGILCRVYIL